VRAVEDEALVQRLARERIALTVCPLSNQKLMVYPDLRDHPMKRLLDAGVAVTLHSDDPAYFGGYMNANWEASFAALPLDAADAYKLARNSFEAAFLPAKQKADYLAEVDHFWSATPENPPATAPTT
jgi:adenosine deaminase